MITIGTARQRAAEWVREHACMQADYIGAYFSGSTVGRPEKEALPTGSDVDVVVVLRGETVPPKPGKTIYKDTLIEITYLPFNQLASAERVLGSYHLAGSFRLPAVIDDPSGYLHQLQRQVSEKFADEKWVKLRCEEAWNRVDQGLRSLNPSAPLFELVMPWLFPTGVMTHVLLVAALRNPTVRLRYLAARRVLEDYGFEGAYPELLGFLGCSGWTARLAERHLEGLERCFEAAAAAARTPLAFSSDITPGAKTIAIDGSLELIRSGNPREAVFWIGVTHARCHHILSIDAEAEVRRAHEPFFARFLADLGIHSSGDLLRRAEEGLRFLPKLRQIAESIMHANPEITGIE
ncbi:hypothetical protein VQ056_10355 [Paenibacillus sp. JTLBN-2024]|uniref:Polymerase nucleotidyl transferase domain-containing protein n=1 Tax=Paenibacillus cookii TaxID=157839 RepID=A0ABQ4LTB2_9BACL|nr:hypothetical protein [Paenibacillus cookii]GIO66388.1 hypothetical protein J21TS3_12090 [Paenibacillus cookii]